MGPVTGVIAHHPDGLTLAVEVAIALLLVLVFGGIWLRERRRRTDREQRVARMRSTDD